jgi:hypothetical protein
MGVWRDAERGLVGKLEGKRLLGRTRRRLGDGIKMYLQGVGWEYELDKSGSMELFSKLHFLNHNLL